MVDANNPVNVSGRVQLVPSLVSLSCANVQLMLLDQVRGLSSCVQLANQLPLSRPLQWRVARRLCQVAKWHRQKLRWLPTPLEGEMEPPSWNDSLRSMVWRLSWANEQLVEDDQCREQLSVLAGEHSIRVAVAYADLTLVTDRAQAQGALLQMVAAVDMLANIPDHEIEPLVLIPFLQFAINHDMPVLLDRLVQVGTMAHRTLRDSFDNFADTISLALASRHYHAFECALHHLPEAEQQEAVQSAIWRMPRHGSSGLVAQILSDYFGLVDGLLLLKLLFSALPQMDRNNSLHHNQRTWIELASSINDTQLLALYHSEVARANVRTYI